MFKGIRLNWVLVIAGLVPLWAALFIVFTNMRVLKEEAPITVTAAPIVEQQPLELELLEEKPVEPEKPKGKLGGLFGRFKKEKTDDPMTEEEIDFTESNPEPQNTSIGLPRGLRRIWGVALILVFIACLVYGSDKALVYLFKEYRWVIGTTNPWTNQFELAIVSSSAMAGVGVMIATLKTGLYLIKN